MTRLFAGAVLQRWLCMLAVLCLTSTSMAAELVANASDSSWKLFQIMVTNTAKHNFRGVFVYSNGAVLSSMQVVHRWQDGVVSERLLQLDGDMGEILRDGAKVTCILPNENAISVYNSGFNSPFSQSGAMPEMLAAHYHLSSAGEDRVAGIEATKLNLRALDAFRYSYQLWINNDDGFLLKYLLLDDAGTEVERFQYTQLELGATITDDELKSTVVGKAKVHELPAATTSAESTKGSVLMDPDWQVGWTPPGFVLIQKKLSDNKYDSRIFSDGLASFSVFVVPAHSGVGMPEGGALMGATIAYSRKVTHANRQYDVTIVGEIPPISAMKVAAAVVLKD